MSIDKILTYDTELTDDIGYTVHPINLALGESLGHTVKVNVHRNGTKITDSASCKAKFLRSDGSTVEINGTFASGVASVTLPSSCYTVEGAAKLSVSLVSGSTISTVFIMICNVNRYSTTAIVDSNQVVPNIETLLANVDKLETLIGEAEGLSLNKVGYAEASGNVLTLYSDNTKKKVVSSVILPSGNSYDDTEIREQLADLNDDLSTLSESIVEINDDFAKVEKSLFNYIENGVRESNNFYSSISPLDTSKTYAFEITTSINCKAIVKTGTSASESNMKDVLGTFDFVANVPKIIIGYIPSGNYRFFKMSVANEYTVKVYEFINTANSIFMLDNTLKKCARFRASASCKVGDELITSSNVVIGDGWTGNNDIGFTHTSGKSESLTFNINATNGYDYLIEFDCTNLTDDHLLVKIGNSYASQTYNGGNHISTVVKDVTNGGALQIVISKDNFNGVVKNVSCRRISDNGTHEKVFDVDVISIKDINNNPTGFWNVILSNSGFSNNVNSTRTICIGEYAMSALIAGNRNIAIGTFALSQLLDGEKNISIGADSMIYVKHGISNIAIGKGVMEYGNTLEHNVAIGENALKGSATSNSKHTIAIGQNAGYYCDQSYNAFIGRNAGYKSRGIQNVAIGDSAYKTNVYGHENTCVGVMSDTNDGAVNSIAIGYNAKTTKSNQCVIGNSSVTEFILGSKKIKFNVDHTVTWEEI